MTALVDHIRRFSGDQHGATAVEFAILMPIMLVCFGAIVEGARIYWNYQSVVNGVRDATRFIARVSPEDICEGLPAATLWPGHNIVGDAMAMERLNANIRSGGAENLFPLGVSLSGLQTRLFCIPTPGHALPLTPVAVVRVQVQIELPFGSVFEIFGARDNAVMTSWITDQARIYGI